MHISPSTLFCTTFFTLIRHIRSRWPASQSVPRECPSGASQRGLALKSCLGIFRGRSLLGIISAQPTSNFQLGTLPFTLGITCRRRIVQRSTSRRAGLRQPRRRLMQISTDSHSFCRKSKVRLACFLFNSKFRLQNIVTG